MTRPKTVRGLAPILVMATLALSACGKKPEPATTAAQQAKSVRVVRVEAHEIAGSLAASGALVPREEAAVFPEVSGYRVAAVLVDEGAYVRQGQTLARLDPALISSQVAQQEALAAQAAVQAANAEAQAERVKDLDGTGVLSQEQIDQRRSAARAARAQADAQAAGLRDARTRAGKLAVTAPVSGLVLSRTVRPGDTSGAAAQPWFRLARGGQIELQAELSEDDMARIRPGQAATVTFPSGGTAIGTVRLVSPEISAQTKLGHVRVSLPVRPDIRAGGFGRAIFSDARAMTLAVPETAVRYDADGASVMVVGADNRVKRVLVTTGARGSGLVQLVRGPAAGSIVVRNAAAFLLDGDRVRPVADAAR